MNLAQALIKVVEWSPIIEPDIAVATPVRVLLLLRSLSGGGAERVAVNLVGNCDPKRVDVRLGLLRRDGEYLSDAFDSRIITPGDTATRSVMFAPADIAGMIRQVRPEVVMSFGMGVDLLTWLGLRLHHGPRPRWICRQDNNPDNELSKLPDSRLARGVVGGLARIARASADARVAVSNDLAARMDHARGEHAPLRVIYNPTDVDHILAMA